MHVYPSRGLGFDVQFEIEKAAFVCRLVDVLLGDAKMSALLAGFGFSFKQLPDWAAGFPIPFEA